MKIMEVMVKVSCFDENLFIANLLMLTILALLAAVLATNFNAKSRAAFLANAFEDLGYENVSDICPAQVTYSTTVNPAIAKLRIEHIGCRYHDCTVVLVPTSNTFPCSSLATSQTWSYSVVQPAGQIMMQPLCMVIPHVTPKSQNMELVTLANNHDMYDEGFKAKKHLVGTSYSEAKKYTRQADAKLSEWLDDGFDGYKGKSWS